MSDAYVPLPIPEIQVETVLDVPWCDVDSMRVVWHGHYVRYLEQARATFFRHIDYDFDAMDASGYQWPIVDCHLRYIQPLRYGMMIRIVTRLVEFENRLKLSYTIYDHATHKRLTKAETVQLPIDMRTGQMQVETPPILRQKLGVQP